MRKLLPKSTMRKFCLLCTVVVVVLTACSAADATPVATVTTRPTQIPPSATAVPLPTITSTPVPVGITEIANLGKGSAEHIDWSPDGKLFAVGGSLGVHIYDVQTKVELGFFPFPVNSSFWRPTTVASGIRFSPDSNLIAIITGRHIRVIDLRDNSMFVLVGGDYDRFGSVFSSDSQRIAYISRCYEYCKDSIYLYEVKRNAEPRILNIENPYPGFPMVGVYFNQIAFDPSGAFLFAAAEDSTIYAWDIATGQLKYSLKGHTNEVLGLVFSPDGKYLASYGKDYRVFVWNAETRQRYRSIVGYQGEIKKIFFSPDGSHLSLVFDDNSMLTRELATGETVTTETYVDSDAILLQKLRSNGGYIEYVSAIAYSPDGQTLAVGSHSSAPVLLWDVSTQKIRATLDTKATQLLYSHAGDLLVSRTEDENISFWDTQTNRKIADIQSDYEYITNFAFSPDDRTLAVAAEKKVDLWDVQKRIVRRTIITPGEWIKFLSYSPDGKALTVVSMENLPDYTSRFFVQSWDVSLGSLVKEFLPQDNNLGYHGAVISIRDENLIIYKHSDTESNVEIWNINTGELVRKIEGFHDYIPPDLAYSPDGRILAISSRVGTIYTDYGVVFFDTNTAQPIYIHRQNIGQAQLVFSPDGQQLVIANPSGNSGNIRILDVSQIVEAASSVNP